MEEKKMGDMYREILVKRESGMMKKMLKNAIPVIAVLFLLMGAVIPLFLVGAVVFGVLAYFVAPKLEVEYEYLYVNGELDIDAIYSRQKRKRIGSYDMAELEILAPENSHAIDSYRNNRNLKIKDYTSGTGKEKNYMLVFNHNQGQQAIKAELDEIILADIRRIAPRKVNLI